MRLSGGQDEQVNVVLAYNIFQVATSTVACQAINAGAIYCHRAPAANIQLWMSHKGCILKRLIFKPSSIQLRIKRLERGRIITLGFPDLFVMVRDVAILTLCIFS